MTFLHGLCAAVASVTTAAAPQADAEVPGRIQWANPSFFTAIPRAERDIYVSPGFRYGDYKGRKIELRELSVGGAISKDVEAWYTHTDVLAKGRTVSRFRSDTDNYGVRWYFKPKTEGKLAMAAEMEYTNSSTGRVTSGSSLAWYKGPVAVALRLLASDDRNLDYLVGYTRLSIDPGFSSNVVEFGAGKDLDISYRWKARLQGSLVFQNIDRDFDAVNLELKPILAAGLAYRLTKDSNLMADFSVMPFGAPLAYGRDTAFTMYQLHNITGPVAGISDDPFALVSLRVQYGVRF